MIFHSKRNIMRFNLIRPVGAWARICSLVVFGLLLASSLSAQKKGKAEPEAGKNDSTKIKLIEEVTKSCRSVPGLFTMYQDTMSGKVYLLVMEDQLEKEYIYFSYIENGVLSAGFFKGSYRGSRIFSIRKYFNRLEFRMENTGYYFDPNSPLARSAEANINKPVIASQKIVARNPSGTGFLVDADPIFLSESFQQVKSSPQPGENAPKRFTLGNLSKDKNKYVELRNYPRNTDVIAELVYENAYPAIRGGNAVTDSRSVTIRIQHSLIEVPENDFQPRFDDPRVGYFMHQVNDMTSMSAKPYRDVIHRWNLEKKDPAAALSEPKEPIVWWIENSTPHEFRDAIRNGVLQWNLAFEKAGFRNAVVVKEQPDDADWDAGDIRYNVLRWTSSPQPPFGGYGPSFVNPRTGQILGADIMIELVSVSNRLRRERVFETAGLYTEDDAPTGDHDPYRCDAGLFAQQSMLFGLAATELSEFSDLDKNELVRQSLFRLVLHEVGHTLGLNHNMRGSTLRPLSEVHDKAIAEKENLCNSVMEYPSINFSPYPNRQGLFYDVAPGPYDDWVIEYGYSQAAAAADAEKARLDKILARSADPKLAFGNDADDMRSPGHGIDPRVMIYDLSADPVGYALERLGLVNRILPKLKTKYALDGDSYHELRTAYLILTGEYAWQLRIISRQIAGIYINRAFVGTEGAGKAFDPVPAAMQKAAMAALAEHAFGTKAFSMPAELYPYLQAQRRGFNHFSNNEDPHIHSRVLNIQRDLLRHLLHKNVLRRVTDSELYGNEYRLPEYMTDLTDAIVKADRNSTVSSMRQNLQVEYVYQLLGVLKPKAGYDHVATSMARHELNRIRKLMQSGATPDTGTKAHRMRIAQEIAVAMEGRR